MLKKIISAASAAALGLTAVVVSTSAAPPAEGAVKVKSDSAEAEHLIGSTVSQADKDYELGVSSYFNVFLKEDFTPKGSDCEGRLAIGGSLDNQTGNNNYQIGGGRYNYSNKSDKVADAVVLGGLMNKVAFSFGWKPSESAAVSGPNSWSGQYTTSRYFAVSESTDVTNGEGNELDLNAENGSKLYYCADNDPLIDFDAEFEKIGKSSVDFTDYESSEIKISGDTYTFSADEAAVTASDGWGYVFFNLSADELSKAKNIYLDIPENTYAVFNLSGTDVETYDLNFSGAASYGNGALKPNFYFNGKQLGDYEQLENNVDEAQRILYNYYQADTLKINNSIIGSVLAPNADVDGNWGHISGSLIANSFEGYTEFGYKPFKGSDIFFDDSSSGTDTPIDPSSSVSDTSVADSSKPETSSVSDTSVADSSDSDTSSVSDTSIADSSDPETSSVSNTSVADSSDPDTSSVSNTSTASSSSSANSGVNNASTAASSSGSSSAGGASANSKVSSSAASAKTTSTSNTSTANPATGSGAFGAAVALVAAGAVVVVSRKKK